MATHPNDESSPDIVKNMSDGSSPEVHRQLSAHQRLELFYAEDIMFLLRIFKMWHIHHLDTEFSLTLMLYLMR